MAAPNVPVFAVGDERRLMQIILHVAGNAVKFTKEGQVSVMACVEKQESLEDPQALVSHPPSSDSHFHLRVQVDGVHVF